MLTHQEAKRAFEGLMYRERPIGNSINQGGCVYTSLMQVSEALYLRLQDAEKQVVELTALVREQAEFAQILLKKIDRLERRVMGYRERAGI